MKVLFCLRNFLIKALLLFAIASPALSVDIKCNFSTFTWTFLNSQIYTCKVVEIFNPELDDVSQIFGNHQPGKTNADVIGFDVENSHFFTVIPRNIEKFFPNLIAFELSNGRLTSVSPIDLAPWKNLTHFRAAQNKIETLDGDLLQNSLKIFYLSFRDNLIRNVGAGLLSNLSQLTSVFFRNNACISLDGTTPQGIEKLKSSLLTSCPPLTTPKAPETTTVTTSREPDTTTVSVLPTTEDLGQCQARCSINDEVNDLKTIAEQQALKIDQQNALAKEQAQRIANLEMSVRELASSPCSCK